MATKSKFYSATETGWIIIDPLMVKEVQKACFVIQYVRYPLRGEYRIAKSRFCDSEGLAFDHLQDIEALYRETIKQHFSLTKKKLG